MKKLYYLIILTVILGLVLTGCLLSNVGQVPTTGQSGIAYLMKGTPKTITLWAGQDIDVGTVIVSNDGDNLYVTYNTTDGWVMTETHLAIAGSLAVIPQTKKNNPIPGQFPYPMKHNSVDTYTYIIPMDEVVSTKLFIAAQAEVHKEYGGVFGPEMVVNGGFEFPEVTREANGNYWDIYPSGTQGLGWEVEWFDGGASHNGVLRPETANLELHRDVKDWMPGCENQYATLDTDWEGPGGVLKGEPASVRIYQNLEINQYSHCTLNYEWSPRPGHANNELEVYWNGVPLNAHSESGGNVTSWKPVTLLNLTPSPSSTTKLEFIEVGTPNGLGMFLDCVSVICTIVQEETAWADGERFTEKGNWATYFTYTVQIDGLVLWLDAGSITPTSGVSKWEDQSENNNDAEQFTASFQPTYIPGELNGEPVVRFSGGEKYLRHSPILTGDYTAFYVLTLTESEGKLLYYYHAGNVNAGDLGFFAENDNKDEGWGSVSNAGTPSVAVRTSDVFPTPDDWRIHTHQPETLYKNGEDVFDYGREDDVYAGNLTDIGSRSDHATLHFVGDIAEILVYDRILTVSEREMVEGYLNAKYSIY